VSVNAWKQAPKDQRVFCSFTGADNEYANKIEEALKSNGYVAFKYLNEEGGPKYPAEVAGEMFSEAGHYLVLDTPAARTSVGVWLEKTALERELSRRAAEHAEERAAEENNQGLSELSKGKPGTDPRREGTEGRPGEPIGPRGF
jgi:hypothetical protein